MMKIGLTGNIGSGKTIVSAIFLKMGVPVFEADTEAKKLFDDISIRDKIGKIFGDEVFLHTGEVNRAVLARIIFNDKNRLDALNRIIHPLVRDMYRTWCEQYTNKVYTLYEAAILFESGHYKEMTKVICVTAPSELRISRVIIRDGVTEEAVRERMRNQWNEDKKVALADYVIINDGNTSVIEQVMRVHRVLLAVSRQ